MYMYMKYSVSKDCTLLDGIQKHVGIKIVYNSFQIVLDLVSKTFCLVSL